MPNPVSRWCVGPAAAHAYFVAAPAAPPHPLRLAQQALAQGDALVALAAFERALADEPDLAVAHLGRATCLARLARDAEAADALDRALGNAGAERVAMRLAAACARDGHAGFAMDILGRVLDSAPHVAAEMADDAALRALRDHPRFLQMVGKL